MKLETSEVEREDWGKIAAGSDVGTDEFMARLLRDIDTLLAEVERLRKEYELAGEQIDELETEAEASTVEIARLRAELDAAAPAEETVARCVEAVRREYPASVSEPYPGTPAITIDAGEKPVELDDLVRIVLAAAAPAPPLPAEVEEMRGKLEARVAIIEAFIRQINASPGGEHEKLANELRDAASLLSRWPGVWRPIETAPKMKAIMLFAVTDRSEDGSVKNWKMETGFWHSGFVDHHDMSPWQWCGRQLATYDVQPTHWSPLPEPPHE